MQRVWALVKLGFSRAVRDIIVTFVSIVFGLYKHMLMRRIYRANCTVSVVFLLQTLLDMMDVLD